MVVTTVLSLEINMNSPLEAFLWYILVGLVIFLIVTIIARRNGDLMSDWDAKYWQAAIIMCFLLWPILLVMATIEAIKDLFPIFRDWLSVTHNLSEVGLEIRTFLFKDRHIIDFGKIVEKRKQRKRNRRKRVILFRCKNIQ